jgi:predicted heme/steroid binding protein
MQDDGNLVEYDKSGTPIWASGTDPAGATAVMQSDGAFVVKDGGGAVVWSSDTAGNAGATVVLADTGQLSVVSSSGTPLWAGPGELVGGRALGPGESLYSPSRNYRLTMQGDGNLVLYDASNAPIWATGTNPSGAVAAMQPDGDFVVYDGSNQPLWAANTNGHTGAYLSLLDSGQLAINAVGGTPLWSGPGALVENHTLYPFQSITSPSGLYRLTMQDDGNLVEYNNSGTALWATNTQPFGAFAVMQDDGNLVVYSVSELPIWASGTSGNPGASLSLLNDGELSLRNPAGGPLWGPGILPSGGTLHAGESIRTPPSGYRVTMQEDGNLVEYDRSGAPIWAPGTNPVGSTATIKCYVNFVL